MSDFLKVAASGMLAQRYNMDIISNNIANASTTGYKKSRAVFADTAYEPAPAVDAAVAGTSQVGTGVNLAAAQRLFPVGNFIETGNVLDLAIAGNGFFEVAVPDGRQAYTRDGSFTVDAQGSLTTHEGYLVNPPITVPAAAESVSIGADGVVTASVNGAQNQLGQLNVTTFPNPEGLMAMGHNLYMPSVASGNAQIGAAGTEGRGQIVSGVLEGSNVDMAEEMTKVIEAQRAYQLSMKILQTADEMVAMANNLIR